MGITSTKREARLKRKRRIRKKIDGTPQKPRLSVFRSLTHIYAQIVDDTRGHTLVAASSIEKGVKEKGDLKGKRARAEYVGQLIAQRAADQGITQVVFDRNGFLYHGRIKAVSDGARKGGLAF